MHFPVSVLVLFLGIGGGVGNGMRQSFPEQSISKVVLFLGGGEQLGPMQFGIKSRLSLGLSPKLKPGLGFIGNKGVGSSSFGLSGGGLTSGGVGYGCGLVLFPGIFGMVLGTKIAIH